MLELLLWCMAYACLSFLIGGAAVYGLIGLVDWITGGRERE
jgi:hypothetical protein